MNLATMLRPQEQGNVLFLILIAIAAFAALSYAVTSSNRTIGSGPSRESADAVSSDILSWFSQIDTAVMRMRLSGNIPIERMDFYDLNNKRLNGTSYPFDNTTCTDQTCEVFSPLAGGAIPRYFTSAADTVYIPIAPATSMVPGSRSVIVVNTPNLGTSLPDIAVRIEFVSKEVCAAINRRFGISENLDGGRTGVYVQFMGNSTQIKNALASATAYTWSSPEISGKNTFCDFTPSGPYYLVYHIVIER